MLQREVLLEVGGIGSMLIIGAFGLTTGVLSAVRLLQLAVPTESKVWAPFRYVSDAMKKLISGGDKSLATLSLQIRQALGEELYFEKIKEVRQFVSDLAKAKSSGGKSDMEAMASKIAQFEADLLKALFKKSLRGDQAPSVFQTVHDRASKDAKALWEKNSQDVSATDIQNFLYLVFNLGQSAFGGQAAGEGASPLTVDTSNIGKMLLSDVRKLILEAKVPPGFMQELLNQFLEYTQGIDGKTNLQTILPGFMGSLSGSEKLKAYLKPVVGVIDAWQAAMQREGIQVSASPLAQLRKIFLQEKRKSR